MEPTVKEPTIEDLVARDKLPTPIPWWVEAVRGELRCGSCWHSWSTFKIREQGWDEVGHASTCGRDKTKDQLFDDLLAASDLVVESLRRPDSSEADRQLANNMEANSARYREWRATRDAPKNSKLPVPESWCSLLRSFNGECDATIATRRGSDRFEFIDEKIWCAREGAVYYWRRIAEHFWLRALKLDRPVDVKLVALDVDGTELGSIATRIA